MKAHSHEIVGKTRIILFKNIKLIFFEIVNYKEETFGKPFKNERKKTLEIIKVVYGVAKMIGQ